MSEYINQAEQFMRENGIEMEIRFRKRAINPLWDDGYIRNSYNVTITSPHNEMRVVFWGSENATYPSCYDVLACLQKYDPESIQDFCDEFGYERYDEYGRENKTTRRIYRAVLSEWLDVQRVFEGCLTALREIW